VLITANDSILKEVENLFLFLKKRKSQSRKNKITFTHLLVGQFNLQQRFLELIDREIEHQQTGAGGSIVIKLNNLEDKVLIDKLYEASQKGVKIQLLIRSICCLVPGVKGMSENISINRIVDRYLEHGRVFIFHNAGNTEVFVGSSDWMNRNIYRRIEVCVPVYAPELKKQIMDIIDIQLKDNHQSVVIDQRCANVEIKSDKNSTLIRSQKQIGEFLAKLQA
jgi:polyphosphate kinase